MKHRLSLAIAFALTLPVLPSWGAAPVVTNVVAAQRNGTKLVDIHYDVFDADGDTLKIGVEVSHTGGQTFNIPARAFTGDYGDNIAPGANKLIVWDAGADWDGEYSTQMVVKVIVSDAKGFPGLEWGNEVSAGGFLMGQEGGAEGTGPSKHVNIPWSYWLSKYEITCAQYCEFLNIALAAGKVVRVATTSVKGNFGIASNQTLIALGPTERIVWNVNSFEARSSEYTNHPVLLSWYGSIAFAQFFGYDLPTDAEWEKAARGPDHGGVDQHQVYPWGNTIGGGNANYRSSGDPFENTTGTTPVGYFNGNQMPVGPDMANGFGLYDVIGNALEWNRSQSVGTVESYPSVEDLAQSFNNLTGASNRIFRGGDYDDYLGYVSDAHSVKCYYRSTLSPTSSAGFRVIRRTIP